MGVRPTSEMWGKRSGARHMACCNNLASVLDKLQRTFGAHTTEMVQDVSKKSLADLKISTPTCSFLDAIYGPPFLAVLQHRHAGNCNSFTITLSFSGAVATRLLFHVSNTHTIYPTLYTLYG
jgi:hypothetical protein